MPSLLHLLARVTSSTVTIDYYLVFTFLPYFLSFVTYTSVQRAEFTLYEYVSFDVKFPTKYVMICFVCGLNLEPLQHIIYIIFAQSLICLSFPYFIFLLCNVKFLTLPCSIFFFNSEVGLNFNTHLLYYVDGCSLRVE